MVLYDQNGKKIKSNLHFASNGFFEGYFNLDKSIVTGKYFLKVYTNFMNNYIEDESSEFEVEIINPLTKIFIDNKKINSNEVTINFYPEGGVFLEGVANTIGVKVIDCNENGIELKKGEIIDSKGTLVTTFSTNKFGYGKFDILTTNKETYKSIFKINEKIIQKDLPEVSNEGVTFSINNFSIAGKTAIKVKTNLQTIKNINSKNQTLAIQQNENVNFVQLSFTNDKLGQNLILKNEEFFDGINTIHLLDNNQKKIGERIIYKPKGVVNKTDIIVSKIKNDSISFIVSTPILTGNVSVSVLPSETNSEFPVKSIISSFEFDNFIVDPLKNSNYYFSELSRNKLFELDNFLITTKSKYDWNTIIQKPKENKFDFDHGIAIKGTINTELKNKDTAKINMNAIGLGINEFSSLNSKNEFLFENVLAIDSTKIYFTVIDKDGKKSEQKIFSQLINNYREFKKPFIAKSSCINLVNNGIEYNFRLPKLKNTVALDSVTIAAKKNKLKNETKNGNINSRGFKISEQDANSYRDILSFIGRNGFSVSNIKGEIAINGFTYNSFYNNRNSFQRGTKPIVFIDDIIVQDFYILKDYSLTNVDEIYINNRSSIKIYTKKSFGVNIGLKKSQFLLVKNGFQTYDTFENPKYENVKDDGYLKMGTINWEPNILTNENGMFYFSIPNLYQKSIKVVIEGIGSDGKIISETKNVIIQ